jgi:hypothetical protein
MIKKKLQKYDMLLHKGGSRAHRRRVDEVDDKRQKHLLQQRWYTLNPTFSYAMHLADQIVQSFLMRHVLPTEQKGNL